ncbi:NEDD4-binding protein 2-like 2 [Solea solea]|uniref:NEDD4-binding protein 2-like 2 n=1 Tax=Solea solea TaxID=90069 RepID=UPI00272C3465|nr:NEDD4-binding protein 2-like 2 [Solea solea]
MMSHPDSASTTSPGIKRPRVAGRSSADVDDDSLVNTKRVSSDRADGENSEKERVLKEVGLTSSTFIGPVFPPRAGAVKSDIEDSLSEFYKELEQIDTPDGANVNSGTRPTPTSQHTSQENFNYASKSAEMDKSWTSSGGRHPSWPHWYQNGPYQPRRPRPGMDQASVSSHNQRHYPQPTYRQPNPRLHPPPFHPHYPPPPTFPQPQHVNPNRGSPGVTNHYQERSHFQRPPMCLPPNGSRPHTQGYHGEDHPQNFDRHDWGRSHDAFSDHRNTGRCQFDEDYNGCERFGSGNELWEQQRHCRPPEITHSSALVLILMRGLPGSGKSTLARELLSTGPCGLILSTDDYFDLEDGYRYDPGLLGAAHEWNQSRAKDAMNDHRSPVIIDNTNIQAWEMKPYVQMALEKGYRVDFCEPDTSWKLDPFELEKRNKHGVRHDKIALMSERFSFPVSIDIVLSSQEPRRVVQRQRPKQQEAAEATMRRRDRPLH